MQLSVITPTIIAEAGVDVPADQVEALINHLNQVLEERVGEEVANALTDEKLNELVELQKTATDEQLAEWMTSNVEDLDAIVQDEIDILIGEVSENAQAFIEA